MSTLSRIYLSSPSMGGSEMKYIQQAFSENWIAPLGPNVDAFEKSLADYVGTEYLSQSKERAAAGCYAVALSSGTAAIHLGLKLLGVAKDDIVFCSSLTFAASCNPIVYLDAQPVFIDADEGFVMSPQALANALAAYPNPKAIITVNLYGQSCDYDAIRAVTGNIPILEDAAESLGTTYKGRQTGTLGDLAVLSFNGNKIVTTSGGGALLCRTKEQADKVKFWATQARDPAPWYQHSEIGYNYRLSNISAGIGLGQMEVLDTRVAQKRAIYNTYREQLSELFDWMPDKHYSEQTRWLTVGLLKDKNIEPVDVVRALEDENIEARPVWKPMHLQPVFTHAPYFTASEVSLRETGASRRPCSPGSLEDGHDVSAGLFARGVCLPSDPKMTEADIMRVCDHLVGCFMP